jgi:[ribosomal protein S5]-alanine N-acetyltransferase
MILETERLILRELQESDFAAVHSYASDPEVVRYTEFGPNVEQDTRGYLQMAVEQQNARPRTVYNLGIVLKANEKLIGSCAINVSEPRHRQAYIGYILTRDCWNHGYMTEAAGAMLSFGLQQLTLHRIYATCDPDNIASYRVMEKVGMTREGYLRESKFVRGKWRNSLQYSILESDTNAALKLSGN